jgi:hypothetical protein
MSARKDRGSLSPARSDFPFACGVMMARRALELDHLGSASGVTGDAPEAGDRPSVTGRSSRLLSLRLLLHDSDFTSALKARDQGLSRTSRRAHDDSYGTSRRCRNARIHPVRGRLHALRCIASDAARWSTVSCETALGAMVSDKGAVKTMALAGLGDGRRAGAEGETVLAAAGAPSVTDTCGRAFQQWPGRCASVPGPR